MSLLATLGPLSLRERHLIGYVQARLGYPSSLNLMDYLARRVRKFSETLEGEQRAIQNWAQELYGFSIRF